MDLPFMMDSIHLLVACSRCCSADLLTEMLDMMDSLTLFYLTWAFFEPLVIGGGGEGGGGHEGPSS